jgi:hypothetical protein
LGLNKKAIQPVEMHFPGKAGSYRLSESISIIIAKSSIKYVINAQISELSHSPKQEAAIGPNRISAKGVG